MHPRFTLGVSVRFGASVVLIAATQVAACTGEVGWISPGNSNSGSGGFGSGGAASGGTASGGTASGGAASGGAETGGAASGGATGGGGFFTGGCGNVPSGACGGTGSNGSGGGMSGGSGGLVGTGGSSGGSGGQNTGGTGGNPPKPLDVTFYVVSDTHADPPESYDLRATAKVINAVGKNGVWPGKINGVSTGFVGGEIAEPRGVVFTGDLTGWGTAPTEISRFRFYFQAGNSAQSIDFPGYLGLGNHDVDSADRPPDLATLYRNMYWAWVDERHKGESAPVPVTNFDAGSHNYSWDFAQLHLIQTHRFPGDTDYGLPSSLNFLAADLAAHASDGRPVVLFHHYGMDAFGTQDRWWTAAERAAYREILDGYNVVGIFAGHSHGAMQYVWEGLRVFQVNNAKAENNTGNNDGNGSFAIVRITDERLDVVTCRWLDDQENYEFIAPFYSGAI